MAANDIAMMSGQHNAEYELRRLFQSVRFEHAAAVTLTMKKRVGSQTADPIVASRNFRHFRNRLDHTILGSRAKRYGARLPMIAVLETSADQRLHYHCIIGRPHHSSFEMFSQIVREEWLKTDFGYREVDIQDQPDTGWTSYILKRRQKSSLLDSIDWANCHLIAE